MNLLSLICFRLKLVCHELFPVIFILCIARTFQITSIYSFHWLTILHFVLSHIEWLKKIGPSRGSWIFYGRWHHLVIWSDPFKWIGLVLALMVPQKSSEDARSFYQSSCFQKLRQWVVAVLWHGTYHSTQCQTCKEKHNFLTKRNYGKWMSWWVKF